MIEPERMTDAMDAAYVAGDAAGATFAGLPLQAFSVLRIAAAQAMGHRQLSGAVRYSGEGAQIYEGFISDVIVVLWLVTHGDKEVRRALRQPEWGMEQAMSWAEEIGLMPGSELWVEGTGVVRSALEAFWASQVRIDQDGGPGKKG